MPSRLVLSVWSSLRWRRACVGAQQSEFSKVTSAGEEPTDNQWCVHVGDNRFFPVELKPLLFQSDDFKF
jgi:hypothetical protein